MQPKRITSTQKKPSHPQPKVKPPIKKIDVFIQRIDRKIQDSYQHLRKNKQQLNSPTKPLNQTTLLQPISQFSIQKSKQFDTSSIANDTAFMKLDNTEIMEYIYKVYDEYNIRDPMSSTDVSRPQSPKAFELSRPQSPRAFDESIRRQGMRTGPPSRGSSTNKKINSYKKKIQAQMGSAQTHKYNNKRAQRDYQAQSVASSVNSYRTGFSGSKKAGPRGISRQLQIHTNRNPVAKLSQINLNNAETTRTAQGHNKNQPTKQLFRYCFMCEQPILESNLKAHQSACAPLRLALTYDKQQILKVLNSKLQRLSRQIHKSIFQKDQNSFLVQLRALQQRIGSWMSQSNGQMIGGPQGWSWQYANIQQQMNRSIWGSLGIINKLHWFTRLRLHIDTL